MTDQQAARDCFLALAASVDELAFVWCTDGRMLWTNEAFVRETGMTVDDFGFNNRDNPFIHPEDLAHVLAALAAFDISDARHSFPIENRFIDIWGRTRRLSTIAHKIVWEGEPAWLLAGRLCQERSASLETDPSYRQLVETADDLILRLAADGRIVYSNRRFQRLVDLPVVTIAQRRLQDFIAPEDCAGLDDALRRINQGETLATWDFLLRSAAEGMRRLSAKASRLEDAATPCLMILRDVTEERGLEEAGWRRQKLESLGVLAGGIAHDFNNIITAVLANAELAKRGVAINARLDDICVAGERAAALSRTLLSYIGQAPLERKPINLGVLLRETLRVVAALVDKTAEVRIGEIEPCSACGDPGQLSQIVLNLLTNAAQALEGRPGHVDVSLHRLDVAAPLEGLWFPAPPTPGHYARLRVQDDGAGMGADVLAKIFDPFFTTKAEGRGLGLPAALGIVRAHGGAVRVESQLGQGTSFEAWLPAATASEAMEGTNEEPRQLADVSPGGLILFADDEQLIRSLGQQILELEGYTVELASDGAEAVTRFSEQPERYRAVIIDTMMPRLRGDLAARRLREIRPNLPIVQASGYTDAPGSSAAPEGVVRLPKPYSATQLLGTLAKALAKSAPERKTGRSAPSGSRAKN